ncbi:MAG: BMP family ABC transporter substrate-binding protein [Clostridia bacterium]
MKKVLAIVLAAMMMLVPAMSLAEDFSAAMVTDTGGVNDRSFNQNVHEGLLMAEKDIEGVTVSYLQSTQESDYAPNLETLLDNGTNLIFGVGFLLADAVKAAAEANPDTKYVCVDYEYGEGCPENLVGLSFREEQPGFLTGYVAAKMSKTNKVGFVGGMAVPAVVAYEWGYVAGAKYANPEIEVVQQYANSFNDVSLGKTIATQMYDNGCDIVFMCGGTMGTGGIEAAKEKGKWVIGVDTDQNYLAPEAVITSAMKYLDVATAGLVKAAKDGTFAGGDMVVGLEENMVGLAGTTFTTGLVPAEMEAEIEEIKAQIIAGEIEIPRTQEEAVTMGLVK